MPAIDTAAREGDTTKTETGNTHQQQAADLKRLHTAAGAEIVLSCRMGGGCDDYPGLYLQRATVPGLVVIPAGNRAAGEYMAGRMADAELKIIEDAEPAMFLEKPQTFNQLLEAFLEKH